MFKDYIYIYIYICSALLCCGEIKLIAEKRGYAISDLIANIARTKRRGAEQNLSVRNLVSPYIGCAQQV